MRIRHPTLIRAAGLTSALTIRLLIGTMKFRYRCLGSEDLVPYHAKLRGRYLYAGWHENMLLPVHYISRTRVRVLISQHADGELIAEACKRLGVSVVRGSTTRGGIQAVRRMLRTDANYHLGITTDGPRGPRRRVQQGSIYVAARTGLPLVPVGIGYQRPWRLRSWDRFAVPRPGSFGTCVMGTPIQVPPDIDRDQLEHYRDQLEKCLTHVTYLAERWAEDGKFRLYPKAG